MKKFQEEIVVKDGCAVASTGKTVTVFGGKTSNGQSSNEVFQLKSNHWTRLSPMSVARTGAAAAVMSGKIE